MGFKLPDHKDRQGDAIKARTAALEKFKAKAAAIDPAAVAERAAAKAATEARRMAAAAEKKAATEAAKQAAIEAKEAARLKAEEDAKITEEMREAERKRVRDERYAARKAAKKR
jgi:hypothetical protein